MKSKRKKKSEKIKLQLCNWVYILSNIKSVSLFDYAAVLFSRLFVIFLSFYRWFWQYFPFLFRFYLFITLNIEIICIWFDLLRLICVCVHVFYYIYRINVEYIDLSKRNCRYFFVYIVYSTYNIEIVLLGNFFLLLAKYVWYRVTIIVKGNHEYIN